MPKCFLLGDFGIFHHAGQKGGKQTFSANANQSGCIDESRHPHSREFEMFSALLQVGFEPNVADAADGMNGGNDRGS